ncbi:uncharacterized protein CMU_031830 [Cryptosporidium muris RN66]|uniref:Uncharacterized protein n=1 Tax=Cryptosporidium muris (strain RN66) TaxID=441375 RepID=B6AIK1_CRYMR|nr:uncharacterized protein CMU_031830 [Cryptosporidium muris RN66]EEA08042.1 hypothetical protein, conserved [Cryptosporidium muris RN66]|eukprot:XP_002142391.1 hypothetical protein [Cryptosporidium muris RN66]
MSQHKESISTEHDNEPSINEQSVTANTQDNNIWNLYGTIGQPLTDTETEDINYVSMVAIGAATSAALWKAYFYRPEEMDDFTTYSMFIITLLTIIGGTYVIYNMRKRERSELNQVARDEQNNNLITQSDRATSQDTQIDSSTPSSQNNKKTSTIKRRKQRVE